MKVIRTVGGECARILLRLVVVCTTYIEFRFRDAYGRRFQASSDTRGTATKLNINPSNANLSIDSRPCFLVTLNAYIPWLIKRAEADVRSGIEGRSSRAYEIARQTSCRVSHADDPGVPRGCDTWFEQPRCSEPLVLRRQETSFFSLSIPVSKRSAPLAAGIFSAPPASLARNSNRVRVPFFLVPPFISYPGCCQAPCISQVRLTSSGMVIRKWIWPTARPTMILWCSSVYVRTCCG